MRESYSKDLASHAGPELYAGGGNVAGVATTGAQAGQQLSSDITRFVRRSTAQRGPTAQRGRDRPHSGDRAYRTHSGTTAGTGRQRGQSESAGINRLGVGNERVLQ
jgi:hypothetical protein